MVWGSERMGKVDRGSGGVGMGELRQRKNIVKILLMAHLDQYHLHYNQYCADHICMLVCVN